MSATKKAVPERDASPSAPLKANEEKWSKPLMNAGWTAVPSVILEYQRALGLDALDVNIILHLAMYWWTPDNKPRPAKTTIAKALNVHPRTVQKRIAALEKNGFIRREERRSNVGSKPNLYHFDGLIKEALPFAKQKLAERKAKADEHASRAKQKGRPRLVTANDDEDE